MNQKNILILKFMQCEPVEVYKGTFSLSFQPWVSCTGNSPQEVLESMSTSTRYDSDWEWLMPVVKRIKEGHSAPIVIHNVNYNIGEDFSIKVYYGEDLEFSEKREDHESDITMVYHAVIKFLDWRSQMISH